MIVSMHIVTGPGRLTEVTTELLKIPEIVIHHTEPESGRAIVTLESSEREDQMSTMEKIRAMKDVASAELVYLYDET